MIQTKIESAEYQRKYYIRREILINNPDIPPKRLPAIVKRVYQIRFGTELGK